MDTKKVEVKPNECFIPKEALALASFASKDDYRPTLTGVHIFNGIAEASDGFILARHEIKQGKDFPECIIWVADLLRAGIDRNKSGVTIAIENSLYIIRGQYEIITHPCNGNFPLIDKNLDGLKPLKVESTIYLGTDVLEHLIAGLKKSGHKMFALKIRAINKSGYYPMGAAIEFCSMIPHNAKDSGKLTGLIMPMMNDSTEPNWAVKSEVK